MINIKSQSWYINEFKEVEFGDERLGMRLLKLVDQLSTAPTSSINGACVNSFETKSAYRFFKNEKVTSKDLLEPHIEQTIRRIQDYPVVLAIQDTTYRNYTSHLKTEGLGVITKVSAKSPTKGLCVHTTYATSTEGLALGILHQHIWSRQIDQT